MDIHGFLKSLNPSKIKLGHERTIALMAECENPQKELKVIQIAGTNGKGSVCAILEKIYREAGYKTGLFTSPHLNKLNERIRMNGLAINDKDIYRFLHKYGSGVIRTDASFFETLTAIAFWFFKKNQVDIAIMETGLGGRLDSVTVCEPIATGITRISLDHVEILGNTLEKIASEKAGIMKKNIPCFTINQNSDVLNVLKNSAQKIKCPLETIKPLSNSSIALHGSHQNENAGLALAIIEELDQFNIKEEHISKAIKSINWFGRYQILSETPKIIFDVGHNTDGISAFLKTFSKEKILGQKYLLIALQERKDISLISNQLTQQFNTILCAEIKIKNFMNAKDLYYNLGGGNNLKIINQLTVSYLDHFIDQLKLEDCLCIIGTHYFGELISKKFKISFDRL